MYCKVCLKFPSDMMLHPCNCDDMTCSDCLRANNGKCDACGIIYDMDTMKLLNIGGNSFKPSKRKLNYRILLRNIILIIISLYHLLLSIISIFAITDPEHYELNLYIVVLSCAIFFLSIMKFYIISILFMMVKFSSGSDRSIRRIMIITSSLVIVNIPFIGIMIILFCNYSLSIAIGDIFDIISITFSMYIVGMVLDIVSVFIIALRNYK